MAGNRGRSRVVPTVLRNVFILRGEWDLKRSRHVWVWECNECKVRIEPDDAAAVAHMNEHRHVQRVIQRLKGKRR